MEHVILEEAGIDGDGSQAHGDPEAVGEALRQEGLEVLPVAGAGGVTEDLLIIDDPLLAGAAVAEDEDGPAIALNIHASGQGQTALGDGAQGVGFAAFLQLLPIHLLLGILGADAQLGIGEGLELDGVAMDALPKGGQLAP